MPPDSTPYNQERTATDCVVMKFGGTSVRDAAAMQRVVEIVERERGNHPVVVTSACSGMTDLLLQCAERAGSGKLEESLGIAGRIKAHHLQVLETLDCKEPNLPELALLLDEIEQLVHGVILLEELTPRTTDAFASYGERLSSILLAHTFRIKGWKAALADSREFIITDNTFCDARPLMPEIDRRAGALLKPLVSENEVVIAQGFIGATYEGVTTTIGRGGSDHTGALLGAALGAREIQIWTDVSGILSADPRVVSGAMVVPEITFTEARELALYGAKVLHPDTILPAVLRSIPVIIKNSMRPEDAGTRILSDEAPIPHGLHSLSLKRSVLAIHFQCRTGDTENTVESGFSIFPVHDAPLLCAIQSESRAIGVIEATSCTDPLITDLQSRYSIRKEPLALLALVGAGLRESAGMLTPPLAALQRFPLAFISAGASEHVVLVGIDAHYADEAVRAVHDQVFAK